MVLVGFVQLQVDAVREVDVLDWEFVVEGLLDHLCPEELGQDDVADFVEVESVLAELREESQEVVDVLFTSQHLLQLGLLSLLVVVLAELYLVLDVGQIFLDVVR